MHCILHVRQMLAAFGKKSTAEQRIDITSCQSRIMWSRRIRPMELDTDRLILHIQQYVEEGPEEEVQHHIGNIPTRLLFIETHWLKLDGMRTSWLHRDEIAKEDNSENAMRGERSRNENSWRLVLNAEGSNGPVDQSDDCNEAMEICNRLYKERSAIAGCGTTPILPQQQLRQRPNQ